MPTYEYACTSCGEHLEVVQSFKDDPLTTCPNCGSELRKVFSPIGVVFKGSGFYKTDSRSGSSGSRRESVTAGDKTSPTSGDSSTNGATSSDATGSTAVNTGSSTANGNASSTNTGKDKGSSSTSSVAAAS